MKATEIKTYYQMDTEAIFQEAVRSCVNEAILKITSAKGFRGSQSLNYGQLNERNNMKISSWVIHSKKDLPSNYITGKDV